MTYALLLEECKGYKETGQTYSEKTVQAGNLLETLKDAEVAQTAAKFDPPLNYKILIDSTVKLYCESTAVYQLTTTENDILLGVRSINDRMQVYRNVEWVGLLHEGSHVLVQVPHISHPVQSIVHFIGYLPMESGVHFGVEFLVSIFILVNMLALQLEINGSPAVVGDSLVCMHTWLCQFGIVVSLSKKFYSHCSSLPSCILGTCWPGVIWESNTWCFFYWESRCLVSLSGVGVIV